LYILLVVGTGLLLLGAIGIYLRVRRHLRISSDHGRRELQQEPPQPRVMRKDS